MTPLDRLAAAGINPRMSRHHDAMRYDQPPPPEPEPVPQPRRWARVRAAIRRRWR